MTGEIKVGSRVRIINRPDVIESCKKWNWNYKKIYTVKEIKQVEIPFLFVFIDVQLTTGGTTYDGLPISVFELAPSNKEAKQRVLNLLNSI